MSMSVQEVQREERPQKPFLVFVTNKYHSWSCLYTVLAPDPIEASVAAWKQFREDYAASPDAFLLRAVEASFEKRASFVEQVR